MTSISPTSSLLSPTPSAWPMTWRVNYGQTKLRPVHSLDVAHALEIMLEADLSTMGQTFSLGGPKTYTVNEMMALVQAMTFNKIVRPGLNVPKAVMMGAAKLGDLVWWPMLSPDEVTRRYNDDLQDAEGTLGFKDLGITPDHLEDVAVVYLRRYRSNLYFETPHETSGLRLNKNRKYKVVD